jgi:signal transduction histidine kinase
MTIFTILIFIYLIYLSFLDHKDKELSIHYLALLSFVGVIYSYIIDNSFVNLSWALSLVGFFVLLEIILTSLNTYKEKMFSDDFSEEYDYSVIGIGDFYLFFIIGILFTSYTMVITVFMLNFFFSFLYDIYLRNIKKQEEYHIAMYPTTTLAMIILYYVPFDLIIFLRTLL